MTGEFDNSGESVSRRGGCLDAMVGIATAGRFGIETTATYPQQKIKPSNLTPDADGKIQIEDGTPIEIALRTGRPVIVQNFDVVNKPKISRRIVKNDRLP